MRASMAEALAIGVSIDDEPFLEACRQDRGAGVRKAAHEAALLIPGSAADARARLRAERCLNAKGEFEPLAAFEKEWGQDGLVQAAPGGRGARGWWLAQIVAATPPDFWVARLKQSPRTLVEQSAEGDHADELCEGWALAALRHAAVDWIEPLFDYWRQARPKRNAARVASELTERLFNSLPAESATRVLQRAFDGPATRAMDEIDVRLLVGWEGDWTVELGSRLVTWVQARLEAARAARDCDDVTVVLSRSAFRLPFECLPTAPLGEFLPEPSTYSLRQLYAAVERFNAIADFRRRLIAEAGSSAAPQN